MQAAWPGYWDQYEDIEKPCSTESMRRLYDYICAHSKRPERVNCKSGVARFAVHEAEAPIKNELKSNWSALADRVGVLELCELFSAHWAIRDKYKEAFDEAWSQPKENTLYLLCDFKEHDKLPVGPVCTGLANTKQHTPRTSLGGLPAPW